MPFFYQYPLLLSFDLIPSDLQLEPSACPFAVHRRWVGVTFNDGSLVVRFKVGGVTKACLLSSNSYPFPMWKCITIDPPPLRMWWDAVLQKRLAWALFVLLLSTLVCCQRTELIWAFFLFHTYIFQFYSPSPLPPVDTESELCSPRSSGRRTAPGVWC